MKNSRQLVAKLAKKFPRHQFGLTATDVCEPTPHEKQPAFLVTFEHEFTTIYDPRSTSCGRFEVHDTMAAYGLDLDAVCLIVAHNYPHELHELIGMRFAVELADELGVEKLMEVRRRNQLENDKGVCHSHDFCDANMTMDRAMRACGIRPLPNTERGMSKRVIDLWNAAWDYAKARYLTQLKGARV